MEEDYHRRTHSALGMSPLDKYLSQVHQLKVVKDPAEVNRLFMRREKRRVNNDATFSLAGRLFEVSCALIGQRIEVRFAADNPDEVLVFVDDEFFGKARPVNLADNAWVKRERGKPDTPALSFHEAVQRREEVHQFLQPLLYQFPLPGVDPFKVVYCVNLFRANK